MKRLLDAIAAATLLCLIAPLMLAIAVTIRATSPGPALHRSTRVGRDGREFSMPKFRTMRIDTPVVATHLLTDPEKWVTPVGRWLRKSSLDELPQLATILRGEMSFVGPRPALHNQHDLNAMRRRCGVDRLRPGLTGWAQVNGRDELSIAQKVAYDTEYLRRRGPLLDARILWLTAWKCVRAEGVGGPPETRRARAA